MEKILSVEERMRRAEEIYNKRNMGSGTKYTYTSDNKKKRSFLGRLLKQCLACFCIYAIFYMVTNSEYVFSEDFRNNITNIINVQTNLEQIYNNIKCYIDEKISTKNEQNVDNSSNLVKNEEVNEKENTSKIEIQEQTEENIGGADESQEAEKVEESKSQMELDAEYIKNKIDLEVPVKGYISSRYGLRNPTTATVPKNHTGIDIAATTGTVIKSACDGTIILASSTGDYGKHYQIQFDDIIIVYAHCSKLYFKEGDKVLKGQEIAEVGSTGNSTGPHLHFELRKDGRTINPEMVLNFEN